MTEEQYQEAMRQIDSYVLTTRCRGVLRNSVYATGLPDASRAAIRRKGPMWWRRQPNCGGATVIEIGELVGGWDYAQEEADLAAAQAEARRQAAELAARRKARAEERRALDRQELAEERHETNAQAYVCLIEALAEMAPYIPVLDVC